MSLLSNPKAPAHGIIVPLLYTVDDAKKLVKSAKFPPMVCDLDYLCYVMVLHMAIHASRMYPTKPLSHDSILARSGITDFEIMSRGSVGLAHHFQWRSLAAKIPWWNTCSRQMTVC